MIDIRRNKSIGIMYGRSQTVHRLEYRLNLNFLLLRFTYSVIELDCTVNLFEHVVNILTGSVVNPIDLRRSLGIAYLMYTGKKQS